MRVCWLGFDPAQRGWLDDAPSYVPPVGLGEVMRGTGVGEVVESRHPRFPVGVLVSGTFGWQEYALCDGAGAIIPVRPVPAGVPPTAALGVLGTTGLAAYFGMVEIGRPAPGEVVVVSAAAGATGSVAAQIAKLRGATVIGVAGGPDKCAWLTETAGLDGAVDHKGDDVAAALRRLAPGGVDVFFDNVGGVVLDAVLTNIAERARIVLCGAISTRYAADPAKAPAVRNLPALLLRSARMEGFIALNYADRFDEGREQLGGWVREGRIAWTEDVRQGDLSLAPATLRRLFTGKNLGKQLLQIAEPAVSARAAEEARA